MTGLGEWLYNLAITIHIRSAVHKCNCTQNNLVFSGNINCARQCGLRSLGTLLWFRNIYTELNFVFALNNEC
jgi:hypothetical protein